MVRHKRLKRLEQKMQEQQEKVEFGPKKDLSEIRLDFILSNQEANFYLRTIYRWSVGSMNEEWMNRHNGIQENKSCKEYQWGERFLQSSGIDNSYRYRIDYPEVLINKINLMFKGWLKETGKDLEVTKIIDQK